MRAKASWSGHSRQLGQFGAAGKGPDLQHLACKLGEIGFPGGIAAVGEQAVHVGPVQLGGKLGPAFLAVQGHGHRARQDAPENGHRIGIAAGGQQPDVAALHLRHRALQPAHHPADIGGILFVQHLPHPAGGLVVIAHGHPVRPGGLHVHHVLVDVEIQKVWARDCSMAGGPGPTPAPQRRPGSPGTSAGPPGRSAGGRSGGRPTAWRRR